MLTCQDGTVCGESGDMSPDTSGTSPDSSGMSPDSPDISPDSSGRLAVSVTADRTVDRRVPGAGCEGFGRGPEDFVLTSVD